MENNCNDTIRLVLKGHVTWTPGSCGRLKYKLDNLYRPLADDWTVYRIKSIEFKRPYYTVVELTPTTGNEDLEYLRKALQESSSKIGKRGGIFLFYHCDM